MRSLQFRLLLVASLVLLAFLGLGALALDQAFRESARNGLREALKAQVFALLGAADEDQAGRMRLPDNLPNPRFATPDSGLYALVVGEGGDYRWRSFSLLGRQPWPVEPRPPGEWNYLLLEHPGEQLMVLEFGLAWEGFDGREWDYTLAVAASTTGMLSQVEGFRARLFYWLGGGALLLLFAQLAVLRWGLGPVRRVADDVRRIEAGEIDQIEGGFPTELRGLVSNINALILSGKAARDRYRNSLGDLAHSLKTPLALLQSAMESGHSGSLRSAVREQVPRMDEIVQYQLRRAAASGAGERGRPVVIEKITRRLTKTLDSIYQRKQVELEIDIAADARFLGDQADFMEIMGNLLDNAYKYCRSRIRVEATSIGGKPAGPRRIVVRVEDDGPGIAEEMRDEVISRGARIDQQQPGQGIGLSVAREIIGLYGGSLKIEQSDLGGVRIALTLPGA